LVYCPDRPDGYLDTHLIVNWFTANTINLLTVF
jgi:hypothetical protein